jgi:pilus assembly protein FimV
MVRKLSWLVALLALNCSMGAFALGLGDINMHSALNQRINADIDLLSLRPGDADSIKVILGSPEDFTRAGLDRPYVLNQLRFLVVAKGKGRYRIHVSSEQPIREPFLDFLIQVTWRGGQLLREYTVLLDPPVLMPAPVQVITAPVTRTVAPESAAVTAPAAPVATPSATPAMPEPAPASAAAPANANQYGPIRSSETLWSIANRTRPDRSVSPDQMMQAILQANPDAFISNNINSLKAGQILHIPTASEVAAVDAAAAHAATLKQNEEWRNRRATAAAPAPAPVPAPTQEPAPAPAPAVEATPKAAPKAAPEAAQKPPAEQKPSAAPAPAPAPPQTEARLKVMAPSSTDTAKSAGTAGPGASTAAAGSATVTDLNKEMALASEAVATQRQETEDLRTRLTDLEQQISTMQKMMTIKDEQLASLQAKRAAADTAAAASQQATGALSNPATLVMIGFAAMVMAALLWLALRRRQLGVAGAPPREIRVEPRQNPAPAPVATAAVAAGAVTAAAVRAATKNVEPIAATPQQVAKPVAESHTESDPLSEADIYLAYGRYQQAEDLIKEAMHRDHNPELRLKLLEIYYAAKNATAFEDTARDLRHDVGAGHELWQRALLMGRELCPYSLLFGEDQSDEPAAAGAAHAATTATAPDSYDFPHANSEDTVLAPGRFKQEPMKPDVGRAGAVAEDSLDEVGTKLDLARAYIDMGDMEGARSILAEVLQEGGAAQKDEAQDLLQKLTH